MGQGKNAIEVLTLSNILHSIFTTFICINLVEQCSFTFARVNIQTAFFTLIAIWVFQLYVIHLHIYLIAMHRA